MYYIFESKQVYYLYLTLLSG